MVLLLWTVRASATPLRISYSAIAANTAGIWMAEGSGAFKEYGLDAQLVYISSSATNVQALVGGSSGIVSAAARGAPIVAIGSQMNRPPATLYVQPELTSADQLKGQVLGISRYNSSTHVLSILILRKLGMEKTTTLRVFGDIPAVQVAFDRKLIAGMVSTVKPKGPARALANAADLDIPYAMSVFGVSRSFLRDNRPVVERFLKAYSDGVAMMVFNKERAIKILAEYLHRADPAFLEET